MEINKTLAEVYKNSSDEVKGLLMRKFSSEELGIKLIPKDGDILVNGKGSISIFMQYGSIDTIFNGYITLYLNKSNGYILSTTKTFDAFKLRLATKDEVKLLFSTMAKKGYKWNAKEKKVEMIRWRAKGSGKYYYLYEIDSASDCIEDYSPIDYERWNIGNYFKTKEEAQKYADKFKEILKERSLPQKKKRALKSELKLLQVNKK